MIESQEKTEGYEKEWGNMHLAYMVSHCFKQEIWGAEGLDRKSSKNERRDIQQSALSILWSLREHPHYLAYPNSGKRTVAELLGHLPIDEGMIELFAPTSGSSVEVFFIYARMAQYREYDGIRGETINVPESNDEINEGILTDVVRASAERIKREAMNRPHYHKQLMAYAEKTGLSLEEVIKGVIALLNYYLYSIGYVLPWIRKGTKAEKAVEKVRIMLPVLDPQEELRKKFGMEIVI